MGTVRVLHLPARTPYARKLSGPSCQIVNGQRLATGDPIPRDASFPWLAKQDDLGFFDVLHVHSVEFTDLELLRSVLGACHRAGKRVVLTAHDLRPQVEADEERYRAKLTEACAQADAIVCLTGGSAARLRTLPASAGWQHRLSVLPHGYAVPPDHPLWGLAGTDGSTVRYAMLGAFRPNRFTYALLLTWYYGLRDRRAELHVLSRPLSPQELTASTNDTREVFAFLPAASDRVVLTMRPFATDEEVISFAAAADVLLLPYGWGSHSGQLELAFDLNLIPVISTVGWYAEQWQASRPYVPEPIWVDWSDGAVFAYGNRLLEALLAAQARIEAGQRPHAGDGYRRHRRQEHDQLLAAYAALYQGDARV